MNYHSLALQAKDKLKRHKLGKHFLFVPDDTQSSNFLLAGVIPVDIVKGSLEELKQAIADEHEKLKQQWIATRGGLNV